MFKKFEFYVVSTLLLVCAQVVHAETPAEDADAIAREYFSDTYLVNQDGEEVRFYTDVLKDRIVVINFMFASCEGACPLITQKMRMAREALGGEAAASIRFISISVDAQRDTPAALQEFARKQQADGDWVFLTGAPENVDLVIKKLGQYFPDVDEHSTILIAGNVKSRYWMKIPPNVPAPGVAERLRQLFEG